MLRLPRFRRRVAGLALGLALVVVCPTAANAATFHRAIPTGTASGGYLATSSTWAEYLQIVEGSGGSVSGVLYYAAIENPTHVKSETYVVSGTIAGNSIQLVIANSGTYLGTLSREGVSLNVPEKDGSISTERFTPASLSAYNTVVTGLNFDVQVGRSQAKKKASAQAAITRANSAGATASSDLAAFRGTQSDRASAIPDLTGAVASARGALATAKKLMDTATAEARNHPDGWNGQVCIDSSDASIAARDTEIAVSDAGDAVTEVTGTIAAVRNAHAELVRAYRALYSASAYAHSYMPPDAPNGWINGVPSDNAAAATAARSTLSVNQAALAGIERDSKALDARGKAICKSVR
jgi:hypothetical protein